MLRSLVRVQPELLTDPLVDTTQSTREDVTFRSGGDHCAAWLYTPAGDGPHPVLVMGHGLGAIKEMRLDAYAERFRAAGYACLVFDYRHFGASSGEPRQLLDIERQLDDWRAAIDFARGRPELDGDRVVAWGSSFGGGHAIATAARDQGLAAAVVQCPFTDGFATARALDPIASTRLGLLAVRDLLAARRGRPPVLAALAAPPRSPGFMTSPDSVPGYLGLVPEGVKFRNEVAARLTFSITRYRPGRLAKQVRCPILFCVCEHDSLVPAKATQRHAAKAPRGEVRVYPVGHFDIYRGDAYERAVGDQLAFLARHVPAG
jgi:uncharacterized protein